MGVQMGQSISHTREHTTRTNIHRDIEGYDYLQLLGHVIAVDVVTDTDKLLVTVGTRQ